MKIFRLFLLSGVALLALFGVAAAAEVPAPSSSTSAPATPISTTSVPGGSLTTFSDGVQLFTPPSPRVISDCPSQYFCLWENANFSGQRLQFHDSGFWQSLEPYGFVRQASSFYNNRGNRSFISDTTTGSGASRCHQQGGAGNYAAEWNDRAAAVLLGVSPGC